MKKPSKDCVQCKKFSSLSRSTWNKGRGLDAWNARNDLISNACLLIIIDSPSKRNIMVALHRRLRSADLMLTRQRNFDVITDEHVIAKP